MLDKIKNQIAKNTDRLNTIKDQVGVNQRLVETISKIVDTITRQRQLSEMQDKINKKLIQDIEDIKLELKLNKAGVNEKWKA
jgi:non-homologous end joining protein Ku